MVDMPWNQIKLRMYLIRFPLRIYQGPKAIYLFRKFIQQNQMRILEAIAISVSRNMFLLMKFLGEIVIYKVYLSSGTSLLAEVTYSLMNVNNMLAYFDYHDTVTKWSFLKEVEKIIKQYNQL